MALPNSYADEFSARPQVDTLTCMHHTGRPGAGTDPPLLCPFLLLPDLFPSLPRFLLDLSSSCSPVPSNSPSPAPHLACHT